MRHLSFGSRAVFLAGLTAVALYASPSRAAGSDDDADRRWQHIKALQGELSADAPKGTNEVEYFAPIKASLHDEAVAFESEFPGDSRRWEAEYLQVKTTFFPIPVKERETLFETNEKRVTAIQNAPDAPADLKQIARRTILFQHLDHLDLIETPQSAAALEQRLVDYLHDFPADAKAASMQVRRVDLLAKSDPSRVLPLLAELTKSDNPKVAAAAAGRLAQKALAEAPLDWNFNALDGQSVDFSRYKGKVVLVDFWASWCPDCLRALPKVLAAYRSHHDRGLEVVGISLDNDKDALLSFLKKRDLPWPEYYDGKGWQTDLVTKYGVGGIPEMWLIGKDGRVVATGVQPGELDEKIVQLLAE